MKKVIVMSLALCLLAFQAEAKEPAKSRLAGVQTTTFDGYAGPIELVAPFNSDLEHLVTVHLRAWLSCDPDAYIRTVGGFIFDRLGGQTSTSAMRDGLEVRYPNNAVVGIEVTNVSRLTPKTSEVSYVAKHADGLSVSRVLHLELGADGWRVVKVSKLR
jgi:hypothetical protein